MNFRVSFAVSVALICAVGILGIVRLNDLNKDYSSAIDRHAKPLDLAIDILQTVLSLKIEMRNCILFTGKPDTVTVIKSTVDEHCKWFEDNAASFGKSIVRPDVKALFNEAVEKYYNVFKPGIYKMVDDAYKGTNAEEMTEYMLNVTKPAADLISDHINVMTEIKIGALNETQKVGNDFFKTNYTGMIVILALCVVLSGIVHFRAINACNDKDNGVD